MLGSVLQTVNGTQRQGFSLAGGTSESDRIEIRQSGAIALQDQSAEAGPSARCGFLIPAILPKRRSSQLWNVSMYV